MRPHRLTALFALNVMIFFASGSFGTRAQESEREHGAQTFVEYCSGCHDVDGRGGDKAPSLLSPANLTPQPDDELIRIVHDGTPGGMPPFAQIGDANIDAVVHYLRMLQDQAELPNTSSEGAVTGDVDAGRTLFFGKAECSACHLIQGKGGFIADELTLYGRNRAPDVIRHAITSPDDPLVPFSQVVTVKTAAGIKLSGVLRNEDNFTMALQTEDGRYHLFAKSDLTDVHYTGHSLMPRDYAKRLTPKELDDLVSFIIAPAKTTHADSIQAP